TFKLKKRESEQKHILSRRNFIKTAILGAGLIGAGTVTVKTEAGRGIIEKLGELFRSEEKTKKPPAIPEDMKEGETVYEKEPENEIMETAKDKKKEKLKTPETSGVLNPQIPCEVQDDPDKYSNCESEFILQQKLKKFESIASDSELRELFDFDKEGEIRIEEEVKQKIFNRFYNYYRDVRVDSAKLGKGYEDIVNGLERMSPWLKAIKKVFSEHKVPENYVYISLAETLFRTSQRSGAGAGGPFQFIKSTGKRFGLTINNSIDEREDPIKSAEAAAKTLKHLHKHLGDWDLAVRGYNGGFVNRYKFKRKKEEVTELNDHDFMCNYIPEILNRKKELTKNTEVSSFIYHVLNKGATIDAVKKKFRENNITNLGKGKFQIPLQDTAHRRKVYKIWANANGIIQNLNYLGKVDAICAVINNHNLEEKIESSPLQFKSYTPEKETTLLQISESQKVSIEDLKKINPAILGTDKTIPKGYRLRLPLSYEKYATLKK
ncbi:transglycosylase SLT domain-containing protein, partial [Patescibacteria group bacterium]